MLAEDVARLLEDFGSDLTIVRPGTPTYTPATGTMSLSGSTSFTLRGVLISYLDSNVDGTVVKRGDRRLLAAAEGAGGTPAVGDTVSGYTLLDVQTIAPNGTAIGWACQARA